LGVPRRRAWGDRLNIRTKKYRPVYMKLHPRVLAWRAGAKRRGIGYQTSSTQLSYTTLSRFSPVV